MDSGPIFYALFSSTVPCLFVYPNGLSKGLVPAIRFKHSLLILPSVQVFKGFVPSDPLERYVVQMLVVELQYHATADDPIFNKMYPAFIPLLNFH